jgi:transcriptional regulator with XRE-family HTH domain
MTSFPDWLVSELNQRGMTPADLARSTRKDQGVISRMLRGERKPSPETLSAIARALKLSDETVFQAAGILKPRPELDEHRSRFETLLADLSDDDVDDLYALAISKLERRQAKQLKPAVK